MAMSAPFEAIIHSPSGLLFESTTLGVEVSTRTDCFAFSEIDFECFDSILVLDVGSVGAGLRRAYQLVVLSLSFFEMASSKRWISIPLWRCLALSRSAPLL
jgi:hypothetical protein